MTLRDELIRAGAGADFRDLTSRRATAADVIVMVEPLIRADEREKVLADLRAKVEALPTENVYSHRGPVVLRADALALIDGA
jgi:hypothetical protein